MSTPNPHPLNPNAFTAPSSSSFRYASFQHRLGAIALDAALMVLTLGVGWIIWSMNVWSDGQTPARSEERRVGN